ncbi:uncharacterized protein LOC118456807 isoform X2 [Anopheles albimanus]|uniref:uncharacterized protein LOC118456807 isoform X2 n=1 Tax=Anopheles albimanus TaxID=7167 RepID=UPI00163EB968|nr:uncharacterized protein LOC118456807 isoform X2 [Anopheles albimanus]
MSGEVSPGGAVMCRTASTVVIGMGCSSSIVLEEASPTPNPSTPVRRVENGIAAITMGPVKSETFVAAYSRLDEEICALESTTPGPRLMTAEGWVEVLKSAAPLSRSNQLPNAAQIPNGTVQPDNGGELPRHAPPTIGDGASEGTHKEMLQIILRLDIIHNGLKAQQQEEFVARLMRNAMDLEADHYRDEMIVHAQKRCATLRSAFERLKRLYQEQDALLAMVYPDNTYGSPIEQQLDGELETARDVRDRLGGVVEQWRTAGGLLRAAAKGLHQTVEYWELIGAVRSGRDAQQVITLALDTRAACHGALVALEAAQAALPRVDIPYITIRQQTAVRHALIYLITDLVQEPRYRHTRDVFSVFSTNVTKAVHWVHECYNETLRQDYDGADQAATLLAKRLRDERLHYIGRKFPNKIYVRPGAIG